MVRASILLLLSATAAWTQQSFVPNVIAAAGLPSRVLYGVYKGALVRSADSGVTWTPIYVTEPGLAQPPVQGFTIDSSDSNTLYLTTTIAAGAVWRSTDGGTTWAKANSGLPTSGGVIDYFRQVAGPPSLLYAKTGNQLFRSTDGAASWSLQGTLPGSSSTLAITDPPANLAYFVDGVSLSAFVSLDLGHSWSLAGSLPLSMLPGQVANAIAVPIGFPNHVYVSVASLGPGGAAYLSINGGGSFTDQTDAGLGLFSKMDSALNGPIYAFALGTPGFYRSLDNGQTWKAIGLTGISTYTLGTVDPNFRSTVYAAQGGSTSALVRSTDNGDTWTAIPAVVTPTIAKPASIIRVTLEEGAPYTQVFTVQTLEDSSWRLPVTLSTSGEPWLQLGATSGTTPLTNSLTIVAAGMPPGVYRSTIRINAPQSFNQSVTIPVELTIRPLGSLGPQYIVTTVAGNGNASGSVTNGGATSIGIGAPQALALGPLGQLLISAGNRIWQLSGGALIVLAGNGILGSSGDGIDASQASIANPEAIALDPQGAIYFTEYTTARVRKLVGNSISTILDFSRFNVQQGSHGLLIDSFGRLLLANSSGLLRYDGRLQTVTAYPLSDPFGMVADGSGNVYVSDRGSHQILKFAATGTVSVFAGGGTPGFAGDGSPAAQALLNAPSGLAIDVQGVIYVADSGNQRIRAIGLDGTIHTIAGSGIAGFAGDATTVDFAAFQNPAAVTLDAQGNLFVADSGNNRVRKLTLQNVPTPKPAAVSHAATGSLAPAVGGLFSIYGDLLAQKEALVSDTTWPRSLAGVSVTINGIAAPLYYVSKGLINGQIPYEIAPGTATAIVTVNGSLPAQISFQVLAVSPGILIYNGNRAVAVNPNSSVNGPDAPATPGSYVLLYLSGIGQPDHPVATGAPAPSAEPFARVAYPYSITVNGQPVDAPYLGLAPGYPALAQANVLVPNLPAGDYSLVVTVNGVRSNSGLISIRP